MVKSMAVRQVSSNFAHNPKRGKARLARKPIMKTPLKKPSMGSVLQRPAVRYVAQGILTQKTREERTAWRRTCKQLYKMQHRELICKLTSDGILNDWCGKQCPKQCGSTLGPLTYYAAKGGYRYRCQKNSCRIYVCPEHQHPVFSAPNSRSAPLDDQAAGLFCLLTGSTHAAIHKITGLNHKTIESMSASLDRLREAHVVSREKDIQFGDGQHWCEVEADEVDLGKGLDPNAPPGSSRPVMWEQWGGIVQRGDPKSLVLIRLSPCRTSTRAPGPGPIRKRDWKPIVEHYLKDRKIVLHTDGARSYTMFVRGVLHDAVVHKKKLKMVNGKLKWVKPRFTKLVTHITPEGDRLLVKAGTQVVDRAWQFLKKHMRPRSNFPDTPSLTTRLRSGQWCYWYRHTDWWCATGDLITEYYKAKQ